MNSAPVQLLPIESGSGYKQKTPDTEPSVEKNGKFEDVFDRTVSQNESPPEKAPVEKSKEGADPKKRTEVSESRPDSFKKMDNAETVVREDVAAEKIVDAAEKLKSGLSGKKSGTEPKRSEEIDTDAKKKKAESHLKSGLELKSVKHKRIAHETGKFPAAGGLKSAPESETAAALNVIKLMKNRPESADGGQNPVESRLLEKLKAAAETASGAGSESQKEVKPEISLVSVVRGDLKPNVKADSGEAAAKNKSDVKISKPEAGKRRNNLRIVDHRKSHENIALNSDKNFKHQISESTARNESANSFKEIFGGVQHEGSRPDMTAPQTKQLQASVLSQLKESVNSQIVKQAGIVVKGNGTGEIKLVMKPESLGNVRIHLSLNDNHIAGRIIVENNIVREIFESNLENLYKAFGSEGFENGGLEVSVQGQGGNTENGSRRDGRSIGARAARILEDAVPELVENEWRNNAVNMVV